MLSLLNVRVHRLTQTGPVVVRVTGPNGTKDFLRGVFTRTDACNAATCAFGREAQRDGPRQFLSTHL